MRPSCSGPSTRTRHATGQTRIELLDAKKKKRATSVEKKADAETLTPAEKRKEAWRKKLYRYKITWLVEAICDRIGRDKPKGADKRLLKILIMFACAARSDERAQVLKHAVEGHDGTMKTDLTIGWRLIDPLGSLSTFPPDRIGLVAWSCVEDWLRQPFEGSRPMIRPHEIEAIAADFGIDFALEWRVDEAFLQLHSMARCRQFEWTS